MTNHAIRHGTTKLGVLTAHPATFLVVGLYTLLWLVFERETFDWHGVATIATWLMTLLIQRAAHRDTQAIHAKVDELLGAHSDARTDLAGLDHEEPEDIAAVREEAERQRN